MPLPFADRVVYRKNPLIEVVCQVRFSPILRIDAAVPADFQDRIRSQYPDLLQPLPSEQPSPPGSSSTDKPIAEAPLSKNYMFLSDDKKWKVNLTRNFMSLSSNAYSRWEDFVDKFQVPLRALLDVYTPRNFSRVGLRYIDIISRSKLDLNGVSWRELIRPELLGLMSSEDLKDDIDAFDSLYGFRLRNRTSVCRLAARTVIAENTNEQCFMIDGDFFTVTNIVLDELSNHMNFLHGHASRLIQWCITPRLRDAMEPEPL